MNKGCIFIFLGGIVFGFIATVGISIGAMFLFKDKLIEMKEGYLQPPPLTTELKADYTWEVLDTDGNKKSLEALKDKVAVVHLFSPDCTNCLAEWPTIVGLYEKTAELDVPIICIAINKTEELDDFVAQQNPPFPVYAKTDPMPDIFALNNVPVTFIYAKDGSIAFKHVGSAKWDDDSVVNFLKMLTLQDAEAKSEIN
jgi:thiol-disulfide isomerase/thioredoxin